MSKKAKKLNSIMCDKQQSLNIKVLMEMEFAVHYTEQGCIMRRRPECMCRTNGLNTKEAETWRKSEKDKMKEIRDKREKQKKRPVLQSFLLTHFSFKEV